MRSEEEVAKWQRRLEAAFTGPRGIHGERLLDLEQHESEHKTKSVATLSGFVRLMDAFFDFSIQTFSEAFKYQDEFDLIDVSTFVAMFRRFRSSYNIFWDGYYFDAASHLRGVYENILRYGAFHNGYISKSLLWIRPNPKEDPEEFRKRSRQEDLKIERSIRAKMVGSKSGLDIDTQERFATFIRILHHHVHRSHTTSLFLLEDALTHEEGLSIGPRFDFEKATHYGNIAGFLAWCYIRLLSTLMKRELFTDDWRTRFRVLDESISFTIVGGPFSDGLQEFMMEKYSFVEL